jgi:ribosomal protein S18 acetylase RimI-like enzyme
VLGTVLGTARMSSKTMTVTTRPMVDDDDAMLLFELYACEHSEELSRSGWKTPQQRSFFRWQAQVQEQHICRRHQHLDRRTICINGFSAGRILVDRPTDCYRIVDLSILPTFRNKGIGTMVLSAILTEAADAGVPVEFELGVESPAIKLCRRFGFVEVEDRGDRVLMRWMPAGVPEPRFNVVGLN